MKGLSPAIAMSVIASWDQSGNITESKQEIYVCFIDVKNSQKIVN